jgi:pyruvate ferredoxin oxidoreductase beta subunit
MNTGGQAGSLTPALASTLDTAKGKLSPKKDLVHIMEAHKIPYLATASIAYPRDFIAKVKRAKHSKGFRFIHVMAPCPEPTGWDYPPSQTIAIARLAVETGLWRLFEVENGGKRRVTYKPKKRKPVADFVNMQGRFRNNCEEVIRTLQEQIVALDEER